MSGVASESGNERRIKVGPVCSLWTPEYRLNIVPQPHFDGQPPNYQQASAFFLLLVGHLASSQPG